MGVGNYTRAVVDSHVTILRSNDKIDPAYLFNFLHSDIVQNKIEEMQTGSTNQVKLNRSEILATKVPVAPLVEQRRIVAKLDSLTGRTARAREELGRIPKLIEKYREAILAAEFDGGHTSAWESGIFEKRVAEQGEQKGNDNKPFGEVRKASCIFNYQTIIFAFLIFGFIFMIGGLKV